MSKLAFMKSLLDGVEVEWLPLNSVARILNGYAFKSTRYCDAGIRIIRISDVQKGKMSDKNPKFYPIESADEFQNYLLKENDLVMSLTGNVGRVAMLSCTDLPAGLNQRVACLRVEKNKVLTRYLFHFFDQLCFENQAMSNATGGGQKNLSTKWLGAHLIPIPSPENPEKSLAIQTKIVNVLDTFTALTNELINELTNELNARKEQYNYYREQLLSFEDRDAEWRALGEVGEFVRGKRFTKKDFVADGGIKVIHYGEIYTHYGTSATQTISQVRSELAGSLRFAEPNDVIVSSVSETIEDVGKAVAWLGEDKVAIHDDSYAIRHSLNPKYLSYCLQTKSFTAQKIQYVSRGKVKRLLIDGASKVKIPIPYPNDLKKSRAEQDRIVAILDKFDQLTNSISESLPREIELRQKQYEYYRDLLLSFSKPEMTEAV